MEFASARKQLREKIREIEATSFEAIALELFRFQARHNRLYRQYLQLLGTEPSAVSRLSEIPCLPIQFFKTLNIQTGEWTPIRVFSSSGTTGAQTSRHLVRDLSWYLENSRRGFETFYGDLSRYCVLALLPSYLERSGSSLVAMAEFFIRQSGYSESGFFLYNTEALLGIIQSCQKKQIPILLLGVSFALLDLAEQCAPDLRGVTVMETGGMKGRRREMTRRELHEQLTGAFQVSVIHSEYGMTELFSQAYSKREGIFEPAPTMRVLTREITDPLSPQDYGRTGALNVIDLANIDTIAFIATDDLGRVYADQRFEVLGRMDNSDMRGCNLMVEGRRKD